MISVMVTTRLEDCPLPRTPLHERKIWALPVVSLAVRSGTKRSCGERCS